MDHLHFPIGKLYANSGFARYGGLDTYFLASHRKRQVVGEIDHLADFYSRGEFNFITGYNRAGADIDHFAFHTEIH